MRRLHLAMLALSLGTSAGCSNLSWNLGLPAIRGDGRVVQEAREVPGFSAFEIGGAMRATVGYAEEPSLSIRADENLLPYIKSEVMDGRLVVRTEAPGGLSPTEPIQVTALSPRLEEVRAQGASQVRAAVTPGETTVVEAHGASEVEVREIDAGSLTLQATGASTVKVAGRARSADLTVAGASTLEAADLAIESVQLSVSGASSASLRASSSIRGDVSGASTATVVGSPSIREVAATGASSISYDGPTRPE